MLPISVIIPTYNSVQFIDRALASIFAQTCPANWEVIVIDDGSTDNTKTLLTDRYPDIQYIYQTNRGPAAARNRGLAATHCEWVTFLDADDAWPPDRTSLLMSAFAKNPELMVVAGLEKFVFEDPAEMDRWRFTHPNQERFHIHLGARLFRREAFRQIGLFDETMWFSEDLDWVKRATDLGLPMQSVEELALLYSVHSHSMTYQKSTQNLQVLQTLKKSLDRGRSKLTDSL